MPLFALIEKGLTKKFNVPSGVALRLVVRTSYVGKDFFYYFFLFCNINKLKYLIKLM